jgi:hypothetical protein
VSVLKEAGAFYVAGTPDVFLVVHADLTTRLVSSASSQEAAAGPSLPNSVPHYDDHEARLAERRREDRARADRARGLHDYEQDEPDAGTPAVRALTVVAAALASAASPRREARTS